MPMPIFVLVTSPATLLELAILLELLLSPLLVDAADDEDAAAGVPDPDTFEAPVGAVARGSVSEAGWLVTGLLGSLTVG